MDAIAVLNTRRDELQAELDKLLETPADEKRNLTADEDTKYQELRGEILGLDDRVKELDDLAKRQTAAAEARKAAGTTGEQRTHVNEPDLYVKGGPNQFFGDLARRAMSQGSDIAASDRLARHAQYVSEKRALGNTGAAGGSGGEFAPPEWIVNEWIGIIRAGRVTANLFPKRDYPYGVSSINIPKITGGTTTAIQSTQNSALSQTDMTTSYVQTGFATIGGKQVASQQLLDQTAVNFDQIILNDLAQDYALRVGTQIFLGTGSGTGTGATVNGLANATFGSSVTWTQASPTAGGFYGQCGKLLSTFLGNRLLPPEAWVMHPRRWYWLASSVDANGRPLVVPTVGPANQNQAVNALGTQTDATAATGMVGYFHGLPVYIDPLVPTNLGGGTNQDIVYLIRFSDLMLFESNPQAEAFRETYADSLGVLFRLYAYVGTVLNRHTESLGSIGGTGLVAPTFAS